MAGIGAEIVAAPPRRRDGGEPEQRRRLGGLGERDLAALALSVVSAFAIAWLVLTVVLGNSSWVETAILTYPLFLATYWFVSRELDGPLLAADRVMAALVASAAIAMAVPLLLIMTYLVYKGLAGLTPHFFTQTQQFVGPLSPATAGGAAQAIVGTLEMVGLAVVMSVPLGFLCAVFLNEIGGPLRRPVRIFVDAMSGVPTILAGLFIYAVWVNNFGFSGFAASLAISISMLPIVTRTSEEMLRLVPQGLREASLAMGASEWRTTWNVVLPTARSGLITAIILGVARAVGETAPLIMTAFGNTLMNANPFRGAQDGLPLYIYSQIRESSAANIQDRAWAGALVLMVVVLGLFATARLTSRLAGRTASGRALDAAFTPIMPPGGDQE
jgi:phosphate transport system permease protein